MVIEVVGFYYPLIHMAFNGIESQFGFCHRLLHLLLFSNFFPIPGEGLSSRVCLVEKKEWNGINRININSLRFGVGKSPRVGFGTS